MCGQISIKLHALRGEDLHHQVVRAVEIRLREAVGAQPVLVGDHHQLKTRFLQLQQFGNGVRLEGQFIETVYLIVARRFGNQGAIAIDKEKLLGHTVSAFKASITR